MDAFEDQTVGIRDFGGVFAGKRAPKEENDGLVQGVDVGKGEVEEGLVFLPFVAEGFMGFDRQIGIEEEDVCIAVFSHLKSLIKFISTKF